MNICGINLKKKTKVALPLLLFFVIFFIFIGSKAYASDNRVDLVYFFSSTCGSCVEVSEVLEETKAKYGNLNIIRYDISDLKNKSLLNEYCKTYKVDSETKGTVPVVIIRNQYLYGLEEIKEKLDSTIINNTNINTVLINGLEVNSNSFQNEKNVFYSLNILKVFLLALLNGINPCSISMLLFLIMLLGNKIKVIIKVSIGFCIGKILTFILLGSICFKFINKISSSWILIFLNVFFALIFLYLAILNLADYFNIKKNLGWKIRAQLPAKFRRFNNKVMKGFSEKLLNSKLIILFSIVLGSLMACSEFLCSGQIYLSVIVTVIQTSTTSIMQGFIYLVIYSFSYMIPIICIIVFIIKGKKVFEISGFFSKNLEKIKLTHSILFFVFFIYMIKVLL